MAVEACDYASFALLGDGRIYAWGFNDQGQLGLGHRAEVATPEEVPGLPPMASITCGVDSVIARAEDGGAFVWGRNTLGQLGTGVDTWSPQPIAF